MDDPGTPDFDNASPEQLAQHDRALAIADGIKLYHAAGGIGVASQWAEHARQLAKRGGLTEQEALNLARYRMWKQGVPVPVGPRAPEPTPEQIAARRDAFFNGTPQERAALMEQAKKENELAQQGFYDSLMMPKKKGNLPPQSIAAPGIKGGAAPVPQAPPYAIAADLNNQAS